VESEETKIEAGPQTGNDELLLRDGRRGLFEDGFDLINRFLASDQATSDRTIRGDLTFAGWLNRGHRGILRGSDVEQLTRTTLQALGDVKVIAHEMEKRFVADEVAAAEHRVTIAFGRGLGDESDAWTKGAARVGESGLVAWTNDHAELFDAGTGRFFENDLKRSLRFSVRIDERLERKGALARIGGGDESFADFHSENEEDGTLSRGERVGFDRRRRHWVAPEGVPRVCPIDISRGNRGGTAWKGRRF
jgi:hypothetical protein